MINIRIFLFKNFNCLVVKFSLYLNRHVFIMDKNSKALNGLSDHNKTRACRVHHIDTDKHLRQPMPLTPVFKNEQMHK